MKTRSPRASVVTAAPSSDLFRVAFHNSPAMQTLTRTTDRVLVEVNDAFLRTLGYTRDEVIGTTGIELKIWVHPERVVPFRERLFSQRSVRDFEVDVRTKSGELRTILLSADVFDIDGVPHVAAAGVDITERKGAAAELLQTHERLRQSEERFSNAFRASPAMMAITRLADARFVSVNEAFLHATGYSEEEVLGKTGKELQLHVAQAQRETFLRGVEERGFMRDHEFVIRAKDGRLHTWLASGEKTIIDGEPHLLSVALDISERKEAEAKLRASEQRYRESEARFSTAFLASPLLMTIARLDSPKFVEVNPAFTEFIGLSREQIIGRDSLELDIWVSREERTAFFDQLRRDRVVRHVEVHVRSQNGAIHTVQLSGEVIEINGEPHLITFGLDVTERKRAEAELRESERRLRDTEARTRALYESISAAVVVQDETGIVQINSATLKLFGADRTDAILGKKPVDFSPPTQPSGETSAVAARQHLERALAQGTERFEWIALKRDGTEFPVEVTLTALQIEGRPFIQSVIIDLTERRRAEAELQNALAKERELNQLKSDFVSLVSHEFRTPLEVIMSSADNLERYHERLPAEKRTHLLRTIHKSVARMSSMMEEVLLLGRLDSGGAVFRPAAMDLAAFCRRVRDEMETATGKRCPIELTTEGLKETAQADEAILRHILTNLVSNAVKYSEPGRAVKLSVSRRGAEAVLRISDRGCGIPAADQARLFQAFHRGSNVRQIPGTGLGLVIVQRSVVLHGGTISFKSTEGEGTTFTVRLPLFGPAKSA